MPDTGIPGQRIGDGSGDSILIYFNTEPVHCQRVHVEIRDAGNRDRPGGIGGIGTDHVLG